MAFRRRRRHSETDPFTDLLFNALLGFTFMFLIAVFFLNPKAKHGEIPAKAEYIITATWHKGRPDDIDLWVRDPAGHTVWYNNPEAGLMNLDRDDRGLTNDRILVNGHTVTNPLNQEVVTIRGRAPGEYIVNLNYYQSKTGRPVNVSVEVSRVNPRLKIVYKGKVRLKHQGMERTAVRFTIHPDGSVGNLNTLQASLAH